MLTSKDLMIGDWVMYDPNVFIEDEYESPKKPYPVQIQSGEEIDLAIEGCYSPIPLTPEILEKNGFYLNGIEDYNKPTFNIDYGKWAYANEDEFDVVGDGADVKYVHQLQNALRLCGIEKEITL